MSLTQSQRHWRAWLSALQTRDASLRASALEQLQKFLDYWTLELYQPPSSSRHGTETPEPESWNEVFDVDAEMEFITAPKNSHEEGRPRVNLWYVRLTIGKFG
jgi:hypothetical protein